MDAKWVSVAVALFLGGIGIWMKVADGSLKDRQWWGRLGTVLILSGVTVFIVLTLRAFGVQFRSPIVFGGGGENSTLGVSSPCAVRLTEGKRQDLIRFFRANPKHTVTIFFASKERDFCPYAQDLWQVLKTGGWAPPVVDRVEKLGGPGVIFGASTKDIVTESFLGILSDTNDVHLDVKVGQYKVDRPQDWYIWIRDDWSEWIERSFVRGTL